jgi:hypothetical protein
VASQLARKIFENLFSEVSGMQEEEQEEESKFFIESDGEGEYKIVEKKKPGRV